MVWSVSLPAFSVHRCGGIRKVPWMSVLEGLVATHIVTMRKKTLSLCSHWQSIAQCRKIGLVTGWPPRWHIPARDMRRLTPCAQPCGARPLALQRDSLTLSTCCHANHIHQPNLTKHCQAPPCAIIASRTTWHKHGQFARTARSLPHGQRGLATGSWLIVVLLCRMLLCFSVIRLHRDAASRTIHADRLEGLRWLVASMSCLVVCSSHHSASQGVLRK